MSEDCASQGANWACYAPGLTACTGVGSPNGCEVEADCAAKGYDDNYRCQPNGAGGYSACQLACASDADCGEYLVCDVPTGICKYAPCADGVCPAETFCTPDNVCQYQQCNDARPCAEGSVCSATTFTCAPIPCALDSECPRSFTCSLSTGACVRRGCDGCDTQCPEGDFCIDGACYSTPGHCEGGCGIGRPLLVPGGAGRPIVAPLLRGPEIVGAHEQTNVDWW